MNTPRQPLLDNRSARLADSFFAPALMLAFPALLISAALAAPGPFNSAASELAHRHPLPASAARHANASSPMATPAKSAQKPSLNQPIALAAR